MTDNELDCSGGPVNNGALRVLKRDTVGEARA